MFIWHLHCCLWGCAGSWEEAEGHQDWPAPPGSPQGHAAAQTRAEPQASQLREQCTLPSSGCFCFFREWWVWYPCGNKTAKSELSLFFHNAAPFLRSLQRMPAEGTDSGCAFHHQPHLLGHCQPYLRCREPDFPDDPARFAPAPPTNHGSP